MERHSIAHPRLRDWDPERLLDKEARRELSFWQLFVLYLNPFPLFRDVSCRDAFTRHAAMRYNQSISRYLPGYLRRWLMVALMSFASLAIAEPADAESTLWLIPALVGGITFSVSMTSLSLIGAAWLLLAPPRS